MKEVLATRTQIKKRKPTFRRQDAHKRAEVRNKAKWRKPKGIQSKMRLHIKGYRRGVAQGFRSPVAVRGLSAEGKHIVFVHNVADLARLDPATQTPCLYGRMGMKKKKDVLLKAQEKKITFMNVPSVEAALQAIEQTRTQQKKQKEAAAQSKKEKEKERKKKEKEAAKEELSEKIEAEEKSKIEKQEKDKILTKRE